MSDHTKTCETCGQRPAAPGGDECLICLLGYDSAEAKKAKWQPLLTENKRRAVRDLADVIKSDSDAYIDVLTQLCDGLCEEAGLPDTDGIIQAGFDAMDAELKRRTPLPIALRVALGAMYDHHRDGAS